MSDAFNAAVERIREGEVMFIDDTGVDLLLHYLPMSILARILQGNVTGMIGLSNRPGVGYLQRFLELEYFPPGSLRNHLMTVAMMRWQQLMWTVTVLVEGSIDEHDLAAAMTAAGLRARFGVRALSDRPLPLVAGTVPAPEPALFASGFVAPELPETLLVLENLPGHLVYRDPKAAHQAEIAKLEKLDADWQSRR